MIAKSTEKDQWKMVVENLIKYIFEIFIGPSKLKIRNSSKEKALKRLLNIFFSWNNNSSIKSTEKEQ